MVIDIKFQHVVNSGFLTKVLLATIAWALTGLLIGWSLQVVIALVTGWYWYAATYVGLFSGAAFGLSYEWDKDFKDLKQYAWKRPVH